MTAVNCRVNRERRFVMSKAVFYHAGCPVCSNAEAHLIDMFDRSKCDIEIVNIGQERERIAEAESAGVKSVPAVVVDGDVLHINFGASIEDVKNG
jgi:glutaredoxin